MTPNTSESEVKTEGEKMNQNAQNKSKKKGVKKKKEEDDENEA